MLNYIFQELSSNFSFLNVFSYITFRTGIAVFTSLFIVLLFGPIFISYLKKSAHFNQPIEMTALFYNKKLGHQLLAGFNYIRNINFTLLWSDIKNIFVLICLFSLLSFALIGFFDDFLKIKFKNSRGISALSKIIFQLFFSLMIFYLISISINSEQRFLLNLPFYKNLIFDRGIFIFLLLP